MFGILSVNKPVGPTSRDCVNQIQRLIRPEKAGHAGTLDPLASGVLLIPVGQAVRLVDTIHELPKEYLGTFQLGVSSDSADTESELIPVADAPVIPRSALEQLIPEFVGHIEQVPPVYSAIWIGGKRAHELARDGKEVDIPARRVMIESMELIRFEYPFMQLRIRCGTGTYIRSLGRDLARRLGSDAVMTELIRTHIGPFSIEESSNIEQWSTQMDVEKDLLPAAMGVLHWPQVRVTRDLLMRIHQGKRIDSLEMAQLGVTDAEVKVAILDEAGELRSLLKRLESGQWRSDKSFLVCTDRVEGDS